ncbi:hypothetical protein DASC09_045620 [Saccharomycopsis crataegensis]|uniref:2-dehydropantoate 2-reductase n=1 Tax=Saccharomycopsis crataegensis TaxID=43959 RepID=A0AAV5QS58_9ASCO|nr:hypothetical protein DASC09_045620 [Saccharomycopsis crataegensis]
MSCLPNVLLIGAGGVGAVVAYSIDYNNLSQLSIVVGRDYEKVKDAGYEINSVDHGTVHGWKPAHIYPNINAAAAANDPYDFVVVTTKNLPDIQKVEDLIEPVVTKEITTVVLIQNGFDLGRPIIAKYPENVCLSGVTFIGSHNYGGVIKQTQHEVTQISYFPNSHLSKEVQESKAKEFVKLYSTDKNSVTYSEDSKFSRYRKLVYNGTLNTICTLVGTDTGRVELSGGNESIVIPAMKEIIAVAKADGVILPPTTINDMLHDDDGDYFTPSMTVDSRKGNPLELEVILGNLLKVAGEVGVETPVLSVIYSLLRIVQFRLKEQAGYITVPKERPIDKSKVWE